MTVLRYLLAALVCYLISNINPAIILSNLIYHKDIRGFGSGNAGTTNSFRVFGPQIGIPVMLFDIGKGALSVYLGGVLLLGGAWYCIAYAGFFAVLGHCYPVAFGFRGGKGVATIAGMLIVLDWRVFLGSLAGFLVVLAIGRMMSVASMSSTVLAPSMNGRYYGGGMEVAPRQDRLNPERKLSLVIMHGSGKLKTLMVFPSIFKGEHVKHEEMVAVHEGREIRVAFDRPVALQIDGETRLNVTEYTVRAAAVCAREEAKAAPQTV